MEEIRHLIKELYHSEEERNKTFRRLELIIDEAVKEMTNMLSSLYDSLKKDNLTVRDYKGNTFDIGAGIEAYSKGIEEKIILNEEKELIYYRVRNNQLLKEKVTAEMLLKEIGFDSFYNFIKGLVKERIRMNNEDILSFRNQTSKIEKYINELEEGYEMSGD